MAPKAIIIPVAVLAAIAVCMFVFICWWFPRAWSNGNAADKAEYDEMRRRRELAATANEDTDVEFGSGAGGHNTGVTTIPQLRSSNLPPVTPY